MNIIDYVATYIDRLDPNHPANVAFGAKLTFLVDDELNEDNNIFLYRFPITEDSDVTYNVEGSLLDVIASERYGICIIPLPGRRSLDLNDDSMYPSFLIRCRHKLPGRAYTTLEELMFELHKNARVFPQNGIIYSSVSSPMLLYGDSRLIYCYQTPFKVLAAERIK